MSLNTQSWTAPELGALFVVTGASGTGKTTLVQAALAALPGITFSVSATTRPIREGERDGVDYHFLDRETFMARVEAGEFLEWAEVYGNCYGTLRAPSRPREPPADILLDIDTQGAAQVRASGIAHLSVFILPHRWSPSVLASPLEVPTTRLSSSGACARPTSSSPSVATSTTWS